MKKVCTRLFFTPLLFICCAWSAFGQAQTDSSKDNLDIVFTKVEIKPSFKDGDQALNNYLNQKINTSNADDNEKAVVMFIVSAKGNIYDIKRTGSDVSFEEALEKALLKSSGQWNSALQNNYHVNAYCRLMVTFHNNKIEAVIE